MDKFQNKYRIPSTRLQNWDYGWNAPYFVTICTIHSRKINSNFDWQTRFHDHIIRDDASYQRIRNYIINNPKNWHDDKFYQ